MKIGLQFLTATAIVVIVLIVGGTCLGVMLVTTFNTFFSISQSWAETIATGIATSVENYYARWEDSSYSFAASLSNGDWNHLPSELQHMNPPRNWTDYYIPQLL